MDNNFFTGEHNTGCWSLKSYLQSNINLGQIQGSFVEPSKLKKVKHKLLTWPQNPRIPTSKDLNLGSNSPNPHTTDHH